MISERVDLKPSGTSSARSRQASRTWWQKAFRLHRVMWACLFLACVGTSWFSYQLYLVSQPASFAPDWQGAQWIQAADGTSTVGYFRYVTNLNTLPDGAFITIAANQVFRLSVNGLSVGTNFQDFEQGYFPRTYMYDVDSLLKVGANVFATTVSNFNEQAPSLRMSIGFGRGNAIFYTGTGTSNGAGWKATTRSDIVYPDYSTSQYASNLWTTSQFDASSWLPATKALYAQASSTLPINPAIYEKPIPTNWISAGPGRDAYFVRRFSLPFGITNAWLRVVAIGNANIFINGHLSSVWDGQPILVNQDITRYLSEQKTTAQYRSGLVVGVYNIASFLQTGENTIAIHVTTSPVSAAQVGLDNLSAAMASDILFDDFQGHQYWLTPNAGWRTATHPVDNWVEGVGDASSWSSPVLIGRPGASSTFYTQYGATQRNVQVIPFIRIAEIILLSSSIVIGFWLFMSLFVMRRYYKSRNNALETMSLGFLPSLACEALLVVLSHEPEMPQPFPYTWQWGLVLIILVAASYMLLWLNAQAFQKQQLHPSSLDTTKVPSFQRIIRRVHFKFSDETEKKQRYEVYLADLLSWLREHWMLLLIIVLALPLVCYNLSYEPYWQDELTSYYAAKGILAHGLPVMPSGFIYTKGELYSYLLALSMAILGEQQGAPRILSVVEYLLTLPLLYIIGCYFFERRIALLATAMLAFSPIALSWGRQVRMYQQAQLFTILTVYLIYKALQERHRVRLIYLSVACIVVTYLSHEETFIILPAIVLWVLVTSKDEKHRAFAVLYQKHWWIAGGIGGGIISLQLLATHVTHPAVLGTDQSQIPFIQFTTSNIPYYLKLLFAPWSLGRIAALPWITLNSILATAGCILAVRSSDTRLKYCAWFLSSSFLTLMLVFTLSSDRYLYPILPIYYLMGAYTMLTIVRTLWSFTRTRIVLPTTGIFHLSTSNVYTSSLIRLTISLTNILFIAAVLILPILPANNYNPFFSQITGISYHRHYPDYDGVGQYMSQHWKKGDAVISIFPAISILYYVGHNDYFFSVDRALYLFERNGQITDTPTGSVPLLNQADFLAVLSTHARVWIISDNGAYQSQVQGRFTFPPDFHLVYQGYQSAIYLRGS